MKTAPTLRDVAKLANVSAGTVSKYLNNPKGIKEKNRVAIEEGIRSLNYTPNTLAQRLAKGKSNVILMYIASENTIAASSWLHQLPLIQTLNDYLHDTRFSLQIKIGNVSEMDKADDYIKRCIASRNIDGVVLLSSWAFPEKNILSLKENDFPFVLIDNYNALMDDCFVACDNKGMVSALVDYLVERGHRKIAFIHVLTEQQHMQERYQGYIEAVEKYSLAEGEQWVRYGDFSIDSGFRCVTEMITEGVTPSAIICGNDNMAVGAIKAIKALGLSVPGDISVAGIDNSIVAQAIEPVLTTMQMPMEEMGTLAIKGLLRRIDDKDYDIPKQLLCAKIVEGASTGVAKPD